MPAAAIAAPIVAAGAGFATAGVTAFTVAAGIGAVASTVGALTGVKELQYAGMGLTAVGGIGSMAESAGLFGGGGGGAGGVAPLANTSVSPLAAAEPAAGAVPAPTQTGQSSAGLGFLQPPTDTVAMVNGGPTSTPQSAPVIQPVSAPIIAQGGGEGGTLGAVDNPVAPKAPGTGLLDKGSVAPALPPPPAATGQVAPAAPAAPGQGATPTPDALINAPSTGGIAKADDGIWSKITTFAEKNPSLVFGALAAGGSFLSGAANPKTPAEVDALKARTALDEAQAEQVRLRTNYMQQGVPKASRRPRSLLNSAVG